MDPLVPSPTSLLRLPRELFDQILDNVEEIDHLHDLLVVNHALFYIIVERLYEDPFYYAQHRLSKPEAPFQLLKLIFRIAPSHADHSTIERLRRHFFQEDQHQSSSEHPLPYIDYLSYIQKMNFGNKFTMKLFSYNEADQFLEKMVAEEEVCQQNGGHEDNDKDFCININTAIAAKRVNNKDYPLFDEYDKCCLKVLDALTWAVCASQRHRNNIQSIWIPAAYTARYLDCVGQMPRLEEIVIVMGTPYGIHNIDDEDGEKGRHCDMVMQAQIKAVINLTRKLVEHHPATTEATNDTGNKAEKNTTATDMTASTRIEIRLWIDPQTRLESCCLQASNATLFRELFSMHPPCVEPNDNWVRFCLLPMSFDLSSVTYIRQWDMWYHHGPIHTSPFPRQGKAAILQLCRSLKRLDFVLEHEDVADQQIPWDMQDAEEEETMSNQEVPAEDVKEENDENAPAVGSFPFYNLDLVFNNNQGVREGDAQQECGQNGSNIDVEDQGHQHHDQGQEETENGEDEGLGFALFDDVDISSGTDGPKLLEEDASDRDIFAWAVREKQEALAAIKERGSCPPLVQLECLEIGVQDSWKWPIDGVLSDALFAFGWTLQNICIIDPYTTKSVNLSLFHDLPELERLELTHFRVFEWSSSSSPLATAPFTRCPKLKALHLQDWNEYNQTEASLLLDVPSLSSLYLDGEVAFRFNQASFSSLPNLRELTLKSHWRHDEHPQFFTWDQHHWSNGLAPQLRSISLHGVMAISFIMAPMLAQCPHVELVRLRGKFPSHIANTKMLDFESHMVLGVGGDNSTNADLSSIVSRYGTFSSVTSLYLDWWSLSDSLLHVTLPTLFPRLENLSLTNHNIEQLDKTAICSKFSHLQSLYSYNRRKY